MSEIQEMMDIYVKQLTEKELITLEIAKSHLGSSFNLSLSLGFLKWNNARKKK